MIYTDEILVQEILETQNPALVSQLYDRYLNRIYRKAVSFVKDAELAEDLTHDIFIKILMSLSSFKGKAKFSTWVYSITYNYCVDYIRRRQKEPIVHNENEFTGNTEPLDEVDSHAEWVEIQGSRLGKILDMLNVEEKSILLMKYQDDLSIKEIQDIFDLSESAAKMRIKRAKEKVQLLYKKMYNELN
ncbi:MAG: RNA polymerase sigma factor [Sphingobacteriales bacterium]|nr:RNA polymerase sigma factor [Sphingobacteriales bacterium]